MNDRPTAKTDRPTGGDGTDAGREGGKEDDTQGAVFRRLPRVVSSSQLQGLPLAYRLAGPRPAGRMSRVATIFVRSRCQN